MKSGQKTDNPAQTYLRGIANKTWDVYESYEFGTRKIPLEKALRDNHERRLAIKSKASFDEEVTVKAVVSTSTEATYYFLSESNISEKLFLDFLNIYNAEGVLSYVRNWGFLDNSDFEFYPPLNMRYKGCLVDEILDASAYLRWLVELADLVNNDENKKLCTFIKHGPRNEKDVSCTGCVAVYLRDEKKNPIYPFETEAGPGFPILARGEEEALLYPISEWEGYGKRVGIAAGQDYLRCAMLRLLRGVQPILEFKKTLGGESILEESILIESPWQSICYSLLLYFTKKANLIICKNCTSRFRSTRKDNLFCSDTCRKAHSRKSKERVHVYSKERKGNKK